METLVRGSLALVQVERDPAQIYLAGLSISGRRTMTAKLRRVAAILGYDDLRTVRWSEMRFEHVTAIRTKLNESQASATINATLCALRGVARAAWQVGSMSSEDHLRIVAVKGMRGSRLPVGRALSLGEITSLFDVCARDSSAAGARDAAILALLLGAGLRRAECAALTIDNYNPEAQSVAVTGKGNKQRLVYLEDGANQAVRDWLCVRGDWLGSLLCSARKGGHLEPKGISAQSIHKALAKRGREGRVSHFSPHDLRKTFASDLIDASGDLSAVQQLMGHSNISTTVSYDRRGEKAKQRTARMLHLPYRSRFT
jgi:site-specific recombinase XerC